MESKRPPFRRSCYCKDVRGATMRRCQPVHLLHSSETGESLAEGIGAAWVRFAGGFPQDVADVAAHRPLGDE